MAAQSLAQQILAVLGESDLPVETPDLIAILATGQTHPRQRVWDRLRDLLAKGLIEREVRRRTSEAKTTRPSYRKAGRRVALWRLAP